MNGEVSASAVVCRDCLAELTASSTPWQRCATCGSPRLLTHSTSDELAIAHIDCDAFYATIEKRDNPSLRDRPLIVGGGRRGVVSTCCYIARTFGVHSAMPMYKALAACPDAVVVRPDMAKYVGVSRQVRGLMLELTPLVEPLSIDEAFLDLSGTMRLHGHCPAVTLVRFAHRIESEIGITVSIGLSYSKFLAKVASDLDKPRGFSTIDRAGALAFLADKPLSLIWGVGRVGEASYARAGFVTIGDMQRADEGDVLRRFGPEGSRLWKLAHGIDARPVRPHRDAKGISAETTFDTDLADFDELSKRLYLLSERVSSRLKAQGLAGSGVTLKLKTSDFKIRTRARALAAPTQLTGRIFEAARELLAKETSGTRFRLVGVGMSDLVAAELADHGDLVDTGIVKEKAAEAAIDSVREKFGRGAIVRGIVFGAERDRRS